MTYRPRPPLGTPYDVQLAAWRLLAEAAADADATAAAGWLEETKETLLRWTDHLMYGDIVADHLLTGPAMLIAALDGWKLSADGDAIEATDDGVFDDDAAAFAHVNARADDTATPGGKLHDIALGVIEGAARRRAAHDAS